MFGCAAGELYGEGDEWKCAEGMATRLHCPSADPQRLGRFDGKEENRSA